MKQISVKDIHAPSDKLEIYLFNVGQGDHILLKFPNMEYGIIDFHYDSHIKLPEPPCLSFFKKLKKALPESEFEKVTISFFCISHTDKDHIKGITETIEWFDTEGVFIRDIWLGAAKDKQQFDNFLREKIPALLKKHFTFEEQLNYLHILKAFEKNSKNFFQYFEKWRAGKFQSKRYSSEERGDGEYLVEIRQLPRPCSLEKCEALNIGPLTTQLDDYIDNLNLEQLKKFYKIKDDADPVDKNLISHILRIKFGEVNTLFGGDTEKAIWERCLAKYLKPQNQFVEKFGGLESPFIKVSHHGSKYSSSSAIWEKIIPKSGKVYLGISAGQHNRYRHPNSETLKDIRDYRNDSKIISTNICKACFGEYGLDVEHHKWYDDFIAEQKNDEKEKPNENDNEINAEIAREAIPEDNEESEIPEMGLFAYIIEVPDNLQEDVKVRMALTQNSRLHECFFKNHQEKLFMCCE